MSFGHNLQLPFLFLFPPPRFAPESTDPENAGLAVVAKYLQPTIDKYQNASVSDVWILAAYVALEVRACMVSVLLA